MEDIIKNSQARKRFCEAFISGRMCKVTGLIVPKFFCEKICHGKPEEVDFPQEIKLSIQRYQQRAQAPNYQGQNVAEPAPAKSFRAYWTNKTRSSGPAQCAYCLGSNLMGPGRICKNGGSQAGPARWDIGRWWRIEGN